VFDVFAFLSHVFHDGGMTISDKGSNGQTSSQNIRQTVLKGKVLHSRTTSSLVSLSKKENEKNTIYDKNIFPLD